MGGPVLDYAVAREYVAGHPLGNREKVSDSFFHDLEDLLAAMHARRTVYVDLHKRENIIVNEQGKPCLIDFQISISWPGWLPTGPLFRIFKCSDEYHLMKHWARCRPDQWECTPAIFRSVSPGGFEPTGWSPGRFGSLRGDCWFVWGSAPGKAASRRKSSQNTPFVI